MKRLFIVSSLFPNRQEPRKGIFVKQTTASLLTYFDLRVCSPIPWTSGLLKGIAREDTVDGIQTTYPLCFFIPKIARSLQGFFYYLSLVRFTRNYFKRFPWDAMIVHWAYPDAFGMVLINQLIKRPLFVYVLGSDINIYTQSYLRRKMILFALRRATRVFSVAYELAEKMVALGIDRDHISVIPRGIDTSRFYPSDKQITREKLGLPADKKIVLFVGALKPVKGLVYLVEAALILRKLRHDLLFLILGEGPEEQFLKKMISENHAEAEIRLVGAKSHDEIPTWINSCDLFCLASLNEGRPNVVLEAIACGCPVVGTDVGDTAYLIRRGTGSGAVVKPKDSQALATAIDQTLNKSWDRDQLAQSVSDLTWDACAQKIQAEVMRYIKS